MGTFRIKASQLSAIGYYVRSGNFLLFPRKGWHIRVDMKPIDKSGAMSVSFKDKEGKNTGDLGYVISSFHIKRDNNHSFISTDDDTGEDMKIVEEESKYVYFVYVPNYTWQPVWGYRKKVQKHKGEVTYKYENGEIDRALWGFACEKARWFLEQMSTATGLGHGLAMGPVQGAKANLFSQL